jgi:hypothetical protein
MDTPATVIFAYFRGVFGRYTFPFAKEIAPGAIQRADLRIARRPAIAPRRPSRYLPGQPQ